MSHEPLLNVSQAVPRAPDNPGGSFAFVLLFVDTQHDDRPLFGMHGEIDTQIDLPEAAPLVPELEEVMNWRHIVRLRRLRVASERNLVKSLKDISVLNVVQYLVPLVRSSLSSRKVANGAVRRLCSSAPVRSIPRSHSVAYRRVSHRNYT